MTTDEKMNSINNLISDIDCLEPLYEWTTDLNMFNILKLDRIEIRHSNMLAWLLNPNELHGLNDKLLKKFLIYATKGTNIEIMKGLNPVDIDLMNLQDTIVYREEGYIDILIVSEVNHLVFAIENKIGSKEHSNQLERYKNSLIRDYGNNYRFVLIYLTPNGEDASDLDNWVSMSYDFVLKELNNLLNTYKIPNKARIYIEDYIKAIRRTVVEDDELIEICKKIYNKHKDAFDLIFENKPDFVSKISDYIYNYLIEHQKLYDISIWSGHAKHYLRFTPNKLVEVCGKMGSGWENQTNLIGFEFQIYEDTGVNLAVIIGPADEKYEEYRSKLFNVAITHNYKMWGKKLTNKWKTISSDKLVTAKNLDKEDVYDTLKKQLDNFMEKKLPTIVEHLLEAF